MRSIVVFLLLCLPAIARADDSLAETQLQIARDAARANHCDIVSNIGAQLEASDPAFYESTFTTDPVVGSCFGTAPPEPEAHVEDREAPVVTRPLRLAPTVAPARPQPIAEHDASEIPPLSGGRIAGEVLLGGLVAVPGLFVGGSIGAAMCDDDEDEFLSCLGPIAIGAYAGGIVGVSVGVYAAGVNGDQNGSFAATLGGALVGGLLGVATRSPALAVIGPIGGAVLGFNLTRGYDHDSSASTSASLISLDRGQLALGAPAITRHKSHGATTTTVSLLGGSF